MTPLLHVVPVLPLYAIAKGKRDAAQIDLDQNALGNRPELQSASARPGAV